jgi:hypothetical protein
MPSNHILINNNIEYVVPDRKMDRLISWLNKNGYTANTGLKKESDIPIAEDKYSSAGAYTH